MGFNETILIQTGAVALGAAVASLGYRAIQRARTPKPQGSYYDQKLVTALRKKGYSVRQLDKSDWAADLVLERDNVRTVVHAKDHYQPVGQDAVQAVIEARDTYRASHAMVVSRSSFTPRARVLAESSKVELQTADSLMGRMD